MTPSRPLQLVWMVTCLLVFSVVQGVAAEGREARLGTLDLRDWDPGRQEAARLDGEWLVAWDRLDGAGIPPSAGAEGWAVSRVPGIWNGQERPDGRVMEGFGVATYRLRLLLPDGAPPLTLRVPQIKSASRVWVNGVQSLATGRVALQAAGERPMMATRFVDLPGGVGVVDLAVEVSNHFHFEGGPDLGFELDVQGEPQRSWQRLQLLNAGALMSLIVLALFVASFVRRGMSLAPGVLLLLLVVTAMRLACTSELILVFAPGIPAALAYRLEYLPIYMFWPIYFYLLDEVFPGRMHRLVGWGLLVFAVLGSLTVVATEPVVFTRLRDVATLFLVLSTVYFACQLAIAVYRRQFGALLLGMGALLFMIAVVHDALKYAHFYESVDLVPLGALAFMVSHALLLARRVVRALHDVRDLSAELTLFNEGLERQVSERTRALSDKSAMLERMLANLSHEVRTPLNAILGTVRIAQRDRSLERLSVVESAGRHLVRLLDSILDLSRLEAGSMVSHPQAVDVRELLRCATELLRAKAEEKGLRLDLTIDPGLAPRYVLDPLRLEQVAINLLGNAVKFTDSGEVAVALERQAGADGDRLVLTVSDSGPGIPGEARAAVFEAFHRVGGGHREGAGLGLAIVQGLVAAMGGTVVLSDRPGGGSVFTVTLSATPAPAGSTIPQGQAPARFVLTDPLDILLVEDAPENQAVMAEYLAPGGHEVTCVGDGATALLLLRTQRFDLLLLDMRIPGVGGLEVTRRIRSFPDPSTALIPIIAVTANISAEDRAQYLEAGVDEVVPKPVDPDLLLDALARHAPSGAVTLQPPPQDLPPAVGRAVHHFAEACREALTVLSAPVSDVDRLEAVAHRMKGSAAAFGFPEVSAQAMALERALERAGAQAAAPATEAARLRDSIAAALRALDIRTTESPNQ